MNVFGVVCGDGERGIERGIHVHTRLSRVGALN